MRKVALSSLLTLLLFLTQNPTMAQTTLSAGDIAFIGINSDGSFDDFAFVLLKSIDANTQINFTDYGWNDGLGFFLTSGDATFTWTATSPLAAGTIVYIQAFGCPGGCPSPSTGVASGSTLLTGSIGDQVFAFQGTLAAPTFIAGIHYNINGTTTANWDGGASSNSTSALPDALIDGSTAVWIYGPGPTEHDNFVYNCSVTNGDPPTIRAAINNASNWNTHNTTPFTLNPFPCSFSIISLAVDLHHFSGESVDGNVHLNWQSNQEINHDYFAIEWSETGQYFVEIGQIYGQGDSQSPQSYQFQDPFLRNGMQYYRLKMTDLDGVIEYSNIIEVNARLSQALQISPNPLVGDRLLHIKFDQIQASLNWSLYDLQGRLIQRDHQLNFQKSAEVLDFSRIEAGWYFLQVDGPTGRSNHRIQLL